MNTPNIGRRPTDRLSISISIVCLATLTACGGGGGSENSSATTPTSTAVGATGTGSPSSGSATVGDSSGFPVGAAFYAMRKQGYREHQALRQVTTRTNPIDVALDYAQAPPVITNGVAVADATQEIMLGGDSDPYGTGVRNPLGPGSYITAGPFTDRYKIVFDADFNVVSSTQSSHNPSYCEWDGVPNFPKFLTGGGTQGQTGMLTTYKCYTDKSKSQLNGIAKQSYFATQNSDGTLKFILTSNYYTSDGSSNGYEKDTYTITANGTIASTSVESLEAYYASNSNLPFVGTSTFQRY